MPTLTTQRVVVATLFLPYTVDFHVNKERPTKFAKSPVEKNPAAPVPNLIETLAAQKDPSKRNSTPLEDTFFDNQPEQPHLTQPRSRARHEENSKKLAPLNVAHITAHLTHRRRSSVDTAKIFAEAPWTVEPCSTGNIGLQNAVKAASQKLDKQVWVGTLGMPTDTLTDKTRADIEFKFIADHNCFPVIVPDAEFEGHYNNYCKQILWPTFHYVVPDDAKSKVYQEDAWKKYKALNERFAATIVKNYQPGDIIWINDYHLMLLPSLLRKSLPNAIIGFFLHIPFPSSELFRCLPTRKEILEGLLGADLIGFQTYSFARHFLQTSSRILSLEVTPRGIQMEDNYVSIGIFPIGIDLNRLNEKRTAKEVEQWMELLREKYSGKKLIVARDKLDHVKGVRQKMLAFEQFLIRHPEWQGKVVLIQVALSTAEQNELQVKVTDVVSRVNSKFSNLAYQPIVYLHQDISFSQYLALLSSADACLITALRDGMNLTSHEYVVCQETKHAPLILSEFTGTYGSFGACIRINPWDYREVGEAIHEALSMNEEEKTTRWNDLYKNVTTNTAQHWAESFISELEKVHSDMQRRFSIHIPHLNLTNYLSDFSKSKQRLFFLDYDGTLASYEKAPGSFNSPHRLLDLLTKLASDPRNTVYVMSGRTKSNLDDRLGNIPNLGLSAENGCYLKTPNGKWENLFENVDLSWKQAVTEIFEFYTERTPGSFIEEKDVSIVWHYRQADHPQYGAWQAAECLNHIEDSLGSTYPIHAIPGNKNVEVMPRDINKSAVVTRVMSNMQPDFILGFGDDRADEEMFASINKITDVPAVVTCTVGSKSTEAQWFVNSVANVLQSLDMLNGM